MKATAATASAPIPRSPESLEEAGLPEEFVTGLLIKTVNVRGSVSGFELAELLALPFPLVDDLVEQLQERRYLQVTATRGPTRGEYVYALTGEGRRRAVEELELSRYVGPAPVPLEDYKRWIRSQTIEGTRASAADVERALDGVVVPDSMLELLGPAVNSGRSMFLYGDSGNGKTLLAKRLSRVFGERYYVPWAVLVDGSVMIVYDPVHHGTGSHDGERGAGSEPGEIDGVWSPAGERPDDTDWLDLDEPEDGDHKGNGAGSRASREVLQKILRDVPAHDRRFAEARRPVVITGGELTLEQLDLQWDSTGRMYQAPPQLKAAGGVLVIDDLGRQRVEVRELLNRWGVPLESRQDHLTLGSGRKIVVPFDCFVIFSTNIEPHELADDAFLRRIHYKIEVPDPDRDEYEQIFRSCCAERSIAYEPGAVDYLYDVFYGDGGVAPRRCHPRDVLDHVQDLAVYRGLPVTLERALLERACRSYFLPSH